MRKCLLVSVFLLLLSSAVARGAVIEAEIDADGPVWVGQRVRLKVTVLVPGWFAKAPRFRLPEVPGLLILDPGDRPLNASRTIDGESMSGTIHEFAVIPRRAGSFTIPPMSFRFAPAGKPGQPVVEQQGETGAVALEAVFPPGAEALETLISAPRVTVTQVFTPDSRTGEAGDAVTREVVFSADDVPGMAFPPVDFGTMDGISLYLDSPGVEDDRERGEFRGRRIERATHVFERAGSFTLPTLVFLWWNTEAEKLERIELPGRVITITSRSPTPGDEGGTAGSSGSVWTVLLLAAAVLGVGTFLVLRFRQGEPEVTEAVLFTELLDACRLDDPGKTDRAALGWLQKAVPGPETATLSGVARFVGLSELEQEADLLQRALFAPGSSWSGATLVRILPRLREMIGARDGSIEGDSLPPLNP